MIINFVLRNAPGGADFNAPDTASFPWDQNPLTFITDTPLEISESDQFMTGFDTVWDLGNIFPTGMSQQESEQFLSLANYVGALCTGRLDLDLVPEPGPLGLLASGGLGLLLAYAGRKRRRR